MAAPKKSVVKEQGQDTDNGPPPEFTSWLIIPHSAHRPKPAKQQGSNS